ncbi:hypothetical protein K2173_022429 [Erythroxylum novogranatense]|uniref:Uncharacterized protein n=1 Tax=Erythroxylum novogranatense TaxID=1862640 RepID=A0AAV8TJB4_9ROSI|nr:hypothetical protein K2173_022429 [Erythroxylum novogranatense]
MASWKKTITSPFRKACTFFNQQQQPCRDKKSELQGNEMRAMDLHGEVMACAYEDVHIMWSILDKAKSATAVSSR